MKALVTATTASNITAVGFQAGDNITTGSANTMIGYNAGGAVTTGASSGISSTGCGFCGKKEVF